MAKKKSRRGAVLLAGPGQPPPDSSDQDEVSSPKESTQPNVSATKLPPDLPLRRATMLEQDTPMAARQRKVSRSFKVGALDTHRNSFSGTPRSLRKGSVAPPKSLLSADTQPRRYSVMHVKSTNMLGENVQIDKLTPASEALTQQQISAFKEAFDLFDKNGGGTIDALELQKTLESVGIFLEEDEIHDVMMRLDKDGNGEIDFEEFLNMMTNTEMFLEAFASRHGDKPSDMRRERDVLLFDALTEFMKKSALKDAHEIVGYYAKTYKKVVKSYNKNKGAHVVGHYADGARLIGLTEKQLVMQLKQLTLSQNYGNDSEKCSPYAQPLHQSMLRSVTTNGRKFGKRRKRKKRDSKRAASVGTKPDSESVSTDTSSSFHVLTRNHSVSSAPPAIPAQALRRHASEAPSKKKGRIILKVVMNRDTGRKDSNAKHDDRGEHPEVQKPEEIQKDKDLVAEHKPGWLSQRNIMYNVDISLPIKYRHVQVDRLPRLRQKVEEAKTRFTSNIAEKKIQHNIRHYKELDSRRIPSPALNNQFIKVFCAYSCAETNNKTAVTIKQLKKLADRKYYNGDGNQHQQYYIPSKEPKSVR
uniref:uncharacterized protein LOC120330477 n=1 Tax=Styela clava TaxID=7725 RepID=UPI00193ADE22|nr:uncharacterized protein LOC120330477 [Styela clava]